jgi:predicted AAA+ superfamily ATPase
MLHRIALELDIRRALDQFRVVALLGPRQSGKTTLARTFVSPDSANYFDLENYADLERLTEPLSALSPLRGLIVIDEVQRRPELYPVLRVLADRDPLPARFLVLGSAAGPWLRQSSESLAGRIRNIFVSGFSLAEVGVAAQQTHWLRGGYPLSFLAAGDTESAEWREAFIQTLTERDLPLLGLDAQPPALRRFWMMLAHYHGQILNVAEIARAVGIKESLVRRYLDALEGVFMVRQLQPWHENLGKRQVKAPKIYFRDSGILHQMMSIRSLRDLLTHPRMGASWEGYVIEEALRLLKPELAYFWATHNGAELDLFVIKDGKRLGIECKRVDAPRVTPSMRTAVSELKLDWLWVIYPGDKRYRLAERIEAIPIAALADPGAWTVPGVA